MIDYTGPRFASCAAAARVLGIGCSTVRRWCAEGLLPHVKSGAKYLVNVYASLELLDKLSRESCPATSAMGGLGST